MVKKFDKVDEFDYDSMNVLLKIGELNEKQRKDLGLEVGF